MMRSTVTGSLRFRWVILFLAAVLMGLGLVQVRHAAVDVFPEFAPLRIEIQTIAVGNSSTEVEELITAPLEEQLAGVEGVKELRSKSVMDLSSILLIFEPGTDQERARQLVAERVAQVTPSLPTWASPPFVMPPLSSTSRVLKIGLTSKTVSQMELSRITYWHVRQRLLRVPGVAQVAIWGEQLQQLHVLVDPKKLQEYDVTVEEVMDSTAQALDAQVLRYTDGSMIGTGGFVETNSVRLSVRSLQSITDEASLARVAITRSNERRGPPVTMADVASVETTWMPMWGQGVVNDGPGLLLVVQKFPDSNTLDVTAGIEAAMHELAPGLQGIEVDTTIFRPATFIETAIENLGWSLAIGILLVVLILIAFLMQWRTTVISLVSIPLSLIAAVAVLQSQDVTMNVMVIAGLVVSIGVVVDDAIIDTENIVRRLRQHEGPRTFADVYRIVVDGSVEVRSAIIYATLIDVVAITPVFFLEGLSGAFFKPLVLAYGVAVLASMVVATTITPAMCLLLLRRAKLERNDPWLLAKVKGAYVKALRPVIRSPIPAMAGVVVLFLIGGLMLPSLGTNLLPNFKERDFLMHWVTKPATSLEEETRISVDACRALREIPGVRNCGSHIGQALLADEVYGVNFGENWISIDKSANYDETLKRVEALVEGYPGMYRDVQTYLRERVKEVLTGGSESIVVRVSGPDLSVLKQTADKLSASIQEVPGLKDPHVSVQEAIPQLDVEVDEQAARAVGLSPGDIRRQAATMIASEEVGDVFQGGRAYDVHVWTKPEYRNSVTSLKDLPITTASGARVKLSDLASVKIAPTPSAVTRVQGTRYLDVGGNLQPGANMAAVISEIERRIASVPLPVGVYTSIKGEGNELASAGRTMLIYGLVAMAFIFLLLYASFGKFGLSILHFLTLPVALVGGVVAAWLAGGIVSLGSLVGFLTVYGIAARNGILMISHFQHLEKVEGVPFGKELVIRGALERLAPILMTASATGLALIPLVLKGNLPGHEIEYPMAVVILGGLITSTLLNLFALPSLYLRFGGPRPTRAREGVAPPEPRKELVPV